jgi:hypothetical protein
MKQAQETLEQIQARSISICLYALAVTGTIAPMYSFSDFRLLDACKFGRTNIRE